MSDGDGIHSDGSPAYGISPGGFRLPSETRLGAVRLQVADLERSLDYYGRVLGLGVLERADGTAVLGAGGGGEPLIHLQEKTGAAPVPTQGRLGLYHFALLLPDRAAIGRFVRHLGEVGARAGASDHKVSEALYLQDPDGLGIEVYADRPRSEWSYSDRQIAMSTDPLDLESLVRAAGDQTWQGMPAGTRLGHIHLHVGDLQAATAFYHHVVGFDQTVWSYPGALFLSAGGYHHHLGVNTWARGALAPGENDAKLLQWELVLPSQDDVRAALDSVAAADYEVERVGDGGVVRDPWGTELFIGRVR